jgi:CRISPR-associated exonuclease Cas4
MLDVAIPSGSIFYGETRRRLDVALDEDLRALTARVAEDTRSLLAGSVTPAPVYEKRKCGACSLLDLCRPRSLAATRSASAWLAQQLRTE